MRMGILSLIRILANVTAYLVPPKVLIAQEQDAASVVLVHGAFADGSSWRHVVPVIQDAGLNVTAVQLPLESLQGDAAIVRRAIDAIDGPVVLVGHSWGGMVITEVGDHEKVRSLVYLSAVAPMHGQSFLDVAHEAPDAQGMSELVIDSSGYVTMSPLGFTKYFAQDLPSSESSVLATMQGALNTKALQDEVTQVAWENRPNFYAITVDDYIVPVELQRMLASRIGASVIEIPASHASMLSMPDQIAAFILAAAR